MTCDEYRRFWCGEVSAQQFASHKSTCESCREAQALDAIVEREARAIPTPSPSPSPGLWTRIAEVLEQEQDPTRVRVRMFPRLAFGLAAVIVVALGIVVILDLRPVGDVPAPRNLLTAQALDRVERLEEEHRQAIEDLERLAAPILAGAETELLLRYRDRLETIDAQIERCRGVLDDDGANAHVRRYLMVAYADKTETLREILEHSSGQMSGVAPGKENGV